MENFIPGLIVGFREGLEAFLIIIVILRYLKKSKTKYLKRNVYVGALVGISASLIVGLILYTISRYTDKMDETAKIWESGASLVALVLLTTFIYWMIKHGRDMVATVEHSVNRNLSAFGVASVSFIMIAREGVEIAIFTFAGKYSLISIIAGLFCALLLTILIYFSLIRINIKILFNITLGYLILQAGFLLGYGIHEGLSALQALKILTSDNILFIKAYDLSKTIFYHKEGIIGLPMYIMFGWYSKPEILQFLSQYIYTFILFYIWYKTIQKVHRGNNIKT